MVEFNNDKELRNVLENFILDKKANGIVHNMHIISANKVFVQLFNNCDRYFSHTCEGKLYRFKKISNLTYKIHEYEFNGTGPEDLFQKPYTNRDNFSFTIKPFDFKLFMIEFE